MDRSFGWLWLWRLLWRCRLCARNKMFRRLPGLPVAARTAAASIDPEKIRAHVRFLSLDLLEGRGPGTRGDQLAAEYIATQFALAGLKPAGETAHTSSASRCMRCTQIEDKTKFSLVGAKGERLTLATVLRSSPKTRPGRRRRTSMRRLFLWATASMRRSTSGTTMRDRMVKIST